MPVPKSHPIPNIVFAVAALLVLAVVGSTVLSSISVAPPAGSGATLAAWADNGGRVRVQALLNDLHAAGDAGRSDDLAGMSRACRSLRSDARAAQDFAPIPDAQAQTHWAAALAHLTRASTTCVNAVREHDGDMFEQASDEMSAVGMDMSQVVDRLSAMNH